MWQGYFDSVQISQIHLKYSSHKNRLYRLQAKFQLTEVNVISKKLS